MTALQPSFMLPPNFLFPPQGQIKPGVVLRDGKHGVPDPSLPLHLGSEEVDELDVTSLEEFHYRNEASTNTKLGLWMDSASFAEIGLSGENGRLNGLVVDSGRTKITRLAVTDMEAYVAKLMIDPVLEEYTKRPRCRAVYLITGIMVAEDATIEVTTGRTSVYKAKIAVSGEGFAVPAKIGAEFERHTSNVGGPTWQLEKPFVLAYEVSKIQRKLYGSTRTQSHTRYALWDDGAKVVARDEWVLTPLIQAENEH